MLRCPVLLLWPRSHALQGLALKLLVQPLAQLCSDVQLVLLLLLLVPLLMLLGLLLLLVLLPLLVLVLLQVEQQALGPLLVQVRLAPAQPLAQVGLQALRQAQNQWQQLSLELQLAAVGLQQGLLAFVKQA